jgi:hypothetical protein
MRRGKTNKRDKKGKQEERSELQKGWRNRKTSVGGNF